MAKVTMRKKQYPGMDNLAPVKTSDTFGTKPIEEEEPDWIGGAPNYDKFKGVSPERVMAMFNID
jgi:hypothetical protein